MEAKIDFPRRAISTEVTPTLLVDDLQISYQRRGLWHAAASNISFSIAPGESFGLVGESGSGKTSVALSVLRYLPKTARVEAKQLNFEGDDLMALPPPELQKIRGDRIAAVYQHPGAALNPSLTIGRQLTETIRRHRPVTAREARTQAADLLARLRLQRASDVLDIYPHELSGGMQQRVTIAMAVSLNPALIVLDEPTTALDASVQADIIILLNELRANFQTSLLVISHDIDLIRRATDRVGVMQQGRLVETGHSGSVFDQPHHAYTRALVASIPTGHAAKHVPLLNHAGPASSPDLSATGTSQAVEAASFSSPPAAALQPVLRGTGIQQSFGSHRVLHGVDFAIAAGETFGLIGESGSGKSTLARIVTGLERPIAGGVEIDGRPVAGRIEKRGESPRRRLQMVFQSPDMTLNPRHKIKRILSGPRWTYRGRQHAAAMDRVNALLLAVRLPLDVLDRYPRELSGGQRQRVAIARAFAHEPGIVILDEPTSALDLGVQAAVLDLLNDLQCRYATAYLFISHDLKVVRYMADRIGVLYRGHLVEVGTTSDVFAGPNHPYTRTLLATLARDPSSPTLSQDVSDARQPNVGCLFVAHCPSAQDRCRRAAPPLREIGKTHQILCWQTAADLADGTAVDRSENTSPLGDESSLVPR